MTNLVELITSGLTTGSATFGTPTTTGLICEPTQPDLIRCSYDGTPDRGRRSGCRATGLSPG